MAANLSQNTVDAALDYLRTNADGISLCSAEPTTYAEGNHVNGTFRLGAATNGAGFTAPLLGAKAGTTPRTVPTAVISGAAITGTGTATWAAILKGTATTELLVVMDMTDQAVTNGNTWGAASVNIGIPRQ